VAFRLRARSIWRDEEPAGVGVADERVSGQLPTVSCRYWGIREGSPGLRALSGGAPGEEWGGHVGEAAWLFDERVAPAVFEDDELS
jgi:hypothetical protein